MKKLLLFLLCVVLGGLLILGFQHVRQEEQAQAAALEELNRRIEPLYQRQLELQAELDKVDEEFDAQLNGMGTLSFLVADLEVNFLRTAADIMEEAGVPGVFALAEGIFPGEDDCVSVEEFRQYLDKGWDFCLVWGGAEGEEYEGLTQAQAFTRWCDDMEEKLSALELDMPAAICFPEGTYTDDLEELAKEYGFTVMVHTGENSRPLVETEIGELWRPGTVSWLATGVKALLEQAVTNHGGISFVVSRNVSGIFDESQFRSMLERVEGYRKAGTLMVATLAQARDYREQVSEGKDTYRDEVREARKAELEQEIEALREEIRQIGKQG